MKIRKSIKLVSWFFGGLFFLLVLMIGISMLKSSVQDNPGDFLHYDEKTGLLTAIPSSSCRKDNNPITAPLNNRRILKHTEIRILHNGQMAGCINGRGEWEIEVERF